MAKLDFPIPEGLQLPEGAEPGGKVEMVATFEIYEDGKTLCLKQVEGMPVEGSSSSSEEKGESGEENMDDYGGTFVGAIG